MRQVLHLLIVDRDRRAALAARYGARWLLPVVTCDESARAAPLIAGWCAGRSCKPSVAGQWLGRIGPDATDWLVPVAAVAGCWTADAGFEWISLDALSAGASVLDYQTWALAAALVRGALPSVRGPFGNLEWPERVLAWIGDAAGSVPLASTPYRVSAHEIVLGADMACGRVYFKGLSQGREAEAELTRRLAAVAPGSFPHTVALERRDDGSEWWLMAACPGRPGGDAKTAAQALAHIQQRLIGLGPRALALPAIDLDAAAQWAGKLLPDPACRIVVSQSCIEVTRASIPRSWIPMDLDPTNVLLDEESAVRFIDVDDSYWGPAPLALATFARRSADPATARRAYEQSWVPALSGIEWRRLEVAATVFQAWLGWNRLKRNVERGEVCAALDQVEAAIRERLSKAIYCR